MKVRNALRFLTGRIPSPGPAVRELRQTDINSAHQGILPLSRTETDDEVIKTRGLAALIALLIFVPFNDCTRGGGIGGILRQFCFLIAFAFTTTGIVVARAKWKDYRQRRAYEEKLNGRVWGLPEPLRKHLQVGNVHGTREEVVLGDRLFAMRTEITDPRWTPSWETLLAREIRIEELEREAGLRPQEPGLAELRDLLARPPERASA